MTFDDFKESLKHSSPPEQVDAAIQALWYDAKGNWQTAHELTQQGESYPYSWVHAYLHRKEGDNNNASYWYSRAGKPYPTETLEAEWESIAQDLLKHNTP